MFEYRPYNFNTTVDTLQRAVVGIEMLFDVFAQLVIVVYVSILGRRQCFLVFHPNLSLMFLNQALTYLVFLVSSLVLNIYAMVAGHYKRHTCFLFYFTVAANTGNYSIAANLIAFIIEQIFATVKFATYENWCSEVPYLGIAVVVAQWIISITLLSFSHSRLISSLPIFASLIVAYLVALVVFLVLPVVSRYLYERHIRAHSTSSEHSLTARYQLSTNVTNARLLSRIVVFLSLTSVCEFPLFFVANYVVGPALSRLLNCCFNICVSLQAIVMCSIVLRSKARLYQQLRRVLCRPKMEPSNYVPKAVDGHVLVVPVKDERRLYFDIYERTWR